MKRYNPFTRLGSSTDDSSAFSTPKVLANHPNSFFAEEQPTHELHQVAQSLKRIGAEIEWAACRVLCDQVNELITTIAGDDTSKLDLS